MADRSAIALILARGGSKGIPRKNLQDVQGRSLVRRAAEACAAAEAVDRVFVYSDCSEILTEGVHGGATPIDRPPEVSADECSSEETVLRFLKDHDTGGADVMLVQPTSPFLSAQHVDKAVRLLHRRYADIDSVVSVFPVQLFLGFLGHTERGEREWRPLRPERSRRQDWQPEIYAETGALYLAKREIWRSGRRMSERCGIVTMSRWESIEIDDPEDLEVARAIAPVVLGRRGSRGDE